MLYSYNGSTPDRLPFRITLSDGRTRTDPASFTDDEVADAGYTLAPEKPTAGEFERVVWRDSAWMVEDLPHPTEEDVNAERDRRLIGGFNFSGARFDSDAKSMQRITGAATLAGFALGQGAQPDDVNWHGGEDPFAYISQDNEVIAMDAPTAFAFGQAAARHETAHVFAARAIKDAGGPIPRDFADDKYWP